MRWNAICEVAQQLGIRIRPELTIQLEGIDSTPAIGYPFAKQLLGRKHPFTALFAYNDISAIGSIWAFREAGLRVPEDISIVGFDDIAGAAYANPGLTTVRQPLVKMGQIAAQTVVDLIEGRGEYVPEMAIEPEFVIRQSTGPAPIRRAGSGTSRQARHSCNQRADRLVPQDDSEVYAGGGVAPEYGPGPAPSSKLDASKPCLEERLRAE